MRRKILIGLIASIVANAYFIYDELFFEIEMTSNIPYIDQPEKMFVYLDGYHHAVKYNSAVIKSNNKISQNLATNPSNIYQEGLTDGTRDFEIIAAQSLKQNESAEIFLKAQLETYIEINKEKDRIISLLNEKLAKSKKVLDVNN